MRPVICIGIEVKGQPWGRAAMPARRTGAAMLVEPNAQPASYPQPAEVPKLAWRLHTSRLPHILSFTPPRRNTEHDAPYWRGQIWININYLALRSLHRYSKTPGPHAAAAGDAYRRLRRALVGNLVTQYHSTGYLWEQYDDESGRGLSSHPFTGWTALLTLAVGEAY